jgi:hypothetical protein
MNHVHYIELKKLVDFFYSSEYDDCLPEDADVSLLQLHARMFALADQYDIPGLSNLAAEKYSSRCTASWTPLELLVSLQDVYETTALSIRRLRNTACMAVRKHLPEMLDNEEVAEMYEKILSGIPDFTKDLLRCYVSNSLYWHCQSCRSLQPMEVLQGRCKKCKRGNSGFGW